MDEYVSRVEYEERQKRIDDETRSQNHRIDKLENLTEQLSDMAASIKVMAVSLQGMQAEQKEQGERLKKIEEEPADKWNSLIKTIITVVATAFITYLLTKGGL
jgi:TolA-binding protein